MGVGTDLWNEFVGLMNKQDTAAGASLFASDAVYMGPMENVEGREAIGDYFAKTDQGLSDTKFETSLLLEDGDDLMGEWTYTYTITGPLPFPEGMPQPPPGTRVKLAGVTVAKVIDGQFATMRDYYDQVDMMRQMGLMPSS